jgi:hypothetical protein
MSSTAFEEAVTAYDALDVALDKIAALEVETLSSAERLELLERNETARRRLPALCHELINELAGTATRLELGGSLAVALAERLHLNRGEAGRRIHEAADLGPRRALTGQPLPPKLPATAAAQHAGVIGAEHVGIVRAFVQRLPDAISVAAAEEAERQLAGYAARVCPDELRRFGAGGAAQSRPQLHRRRAGPPPRRGHPSAGLRRDEQNRRLPESRAARRHRRGVRQVGRPRHVQPRRRHRHHHRTPS